MSTETDKLPAPGPEQLLRERLVDTARQGWINRLIDLSRRNNLLYFKLLQSGNLELPLTDDLLQALSTGEPLRVNQFIHDDKLKANCVRQIARKAMENSEEKGLATLYLALGKPLGHATMEVAIPKLQFCYYP